MKDSQIEKFTDELKDLKATNRGLDNTIAYFKKKVEDLNNQLKEEKSERVNL